MADLWSALVVLQEKITYGANLKARMWMAKKEYLSGSIWRPCVFVKALSMVD